MNFTVMNYVYRTKFSSPPPPQTLEDIASWIPEATFRQSHPKQVVSKIGKVTCMFFPNGAI